MLKAVIFGAALVGVGVLIGYKYSKELEDIKEEIKGTVDDINSPELSTSEILMIKGSRIKSRFEKWEQGVAGKLNGFTSIVTQNGEVTSNRILVVFVFLMFLFQLITLGFVTGRW